MKRPYPQLGTLFLSVSLLASCTSLVPDTRRTELYFGLTFPEGGAIPDGEFQQFLADTVTPRFPDGYTVLAAEGRWRDPIARKTIQEPSRVLVVIRPGGDAPSRKIEEIRQAYIARFHQQSVLRVDAPARASF